jgi:hypothetical protein
MGTGSQQRALTNEFVRFQESVRAFALAFAHSIVRNELEHRVAQLKRSLVVQTARPKRPAVLPTVTAATNPQITAPRGGRKPVWTRDTIIDELTTWLSSGTSIDASFVTRHGPPGLVAATRKVFGRFEAALNVASLKVSKMYPDGPPARRAF